MAAENVSYRIEDQEYDTGLTPADIIDAREPSPEPEPATVVIVTRNRTPTHNSSDWVDQANCRDTDKNVFYPDENDNLAQAAAKRICAGCIARQDCLDYAILARERVGIWGGATEKERRAMLRTARLNARRDRADRASSY